MWTSCTHVLGLSDGRERSPGVFVYQPKEWLQAGDVGKIIYLPSRPSGLLTRVSETVAAWRRRASEMNELPPMSCAELRDSITRSSIPRVFGPEFAREYARRDGFAVVRGRRCDAADQLP
jgi:uncharacterized protein YjiS (DUF1127 family)